MQTLCLSDADRSGVVANQNESIGFYAGKPLALEEGTVEDSDKRSALEPRGRGQLLIFPLKNRYESMRASFVLIPILTVIFLEPAVRADSEYDRVSAVFGGTYKKLQRANGVAEKCPEASSGSYMESVFGGTYKSRTYPADSRPIRAQQDAPSQPSEESLEFDRNNARNLSLISELRTPETDRNIAPFRIRTCSSMNDNRVDICRAQNNKDAYRFQLSNDGPNNIVKSSGAGRLYQYDFENKARQDLGMWITDFPDGTSSSTQKAYVMVFPRTYLPRFEDDGNKQTVTLPNGEKMIFNGKTHEIIGGVFSESLPVAKGRIPSLKYSGSGVMIRADSRMDIPQRVGKATISKNGKTCTVSKSELWPDQSESTVAHFKFPTDAEFDSYLQKRCGFGI